MVSGWVRSRLTNEPSLCTQVQTETPSMRMGSMEISQLPGIGSPKNTPPSELPMNFQSPTAEVDEVDRLTSSDSSPRPTLVVLGSPLNVITTCDEGWSRPVESLSTP